MIQNQRITKRNQQPVQSKAYVLYWMQQAQRTLDNHALEYAIKRANTLQQPLLVFFGLTGSFPDANKRHYTFMLEGVQEVQTHLKKRNIPFVVKYTSPPKSIRPLLKEASLLVVDQGYLRIQKQWRTQVASKCPCQMIQVESDVIVPVKVASQKEEYSAATIRPKITKQLATFLQPLKTQHLQKTHRKQKPTSEEIQDIKTILKKLQIDTSVPPSKTFKGGTQHALRHLNEFIDHKLDGFSEYRNDPTKEYVSHLSPYLHFGQISPLTIALAAQEADKKDTNAFLEELIIRRELAINFVYYNNTYDQYSAIPAWAQTTLKKHEKDKRAYLYSFEEFEHAKTHDPYWNAAQKQMTCTGKMHGYMRMYWGKKIIEWTNSPQQAFEIALKLNNKYELDGRDPNGFTGVAWCFGKHDRAWKERPIFGKIRYMNENGLKRKFEIDTYASRWATC